jgi:hypothetical protein
MSIAKIGSEEAMEEPLTERFYGRFFLGGKERSYWVH